MKKIKIAAFITGVMTLGIVGSLITEVIKNVPIKYSASYTANWGGHELVQESLYELRDGAQEGQYISYGPSSQGQDWYSRSSSMTYDLDKVTVLTSYKEYDNLLKNKQYSSSTVVEQIDYLIDNFNYDVIGGINGTSFDTSNGAPHYGLMINGVEYSADTENFWYSVGFFGILENEAGDQKAVIGTKDEYAGFKSGETVSRLENSVLVDYNGYKLKQAIGGFNSAPSLLIDNGTLIEESVWNEEHPRTAIGIDADGKVITFVAEGRNNNRAGGLNLYEMARIMKDLGCIYAINLDGGGSSSSISRRAGETTYSNRIQGSYGADRSVSSAILFVNSASMKADYEDTDVTFAKAQITPNNDLYIVGTSVQFQATGSNAYGNPTALPADATWEIDTAKSTTTGTIDPDTGLFKSTSTTTGSVYVNLKSGDKIIGSTKIDLSWPSWSYTKALATNFSLGRNEEKELEFTLYPGVSDDNISKGISTWRPFILTEEDISWNLPLNCRISLGANEKIVFHAGNSFISDGSISVNKINGTGQNNIDFLNRIRSTVNIGRGPDMLYDFEDQSSIEEWGVDQYAKTLNYANRSTGQVLFGDHSLAIQYDMSTTNPLSGLSTVATFNDQNGFNPVIPAGAKYFGLWAYIPEGWDGAWFRINFQNAVGTAITTMTRFVSATDKTDKGIVGSGEWRFYYGELGRNISTDKLWTIGDGPYSISYMQFCWAPFADTLLGQSGSENIQRQFEKCKKGTIYLDNIMALYSDPTEDIFSPYVSDTSYHLNAASGTYDLTYTVTDIYDDETLVGIGYGDLKPIKDFEITGIDFSTLEPSLNGAILPKERYFIDETAGTITIIGLDINSRSTDVVSLTGMDLVSNPFRHTEKNLLKNFEVKFIADGQSLGLSATYDYGETIVFPSEPTKTGYSFVGWDFNGTTMPEHDLTISALFEINKYKVTFIDAATENVIGQNDFDFNSIIGKPSLEGYTFVSWDYSGTSMPAHDLTIKVNFSLNKYQITYVDFASGQTISQSNVDYNSQLVKPVLEGHTFASWNYDGTTMPAHDLTVEVKFTVNKYRVTYVDALTGQTISQAEIDFKGLIAQPTISGFVFSNWDYDGTAMPAHDLTIKVNFTVDSAFLDAKTDAIKKAETSESLFAAIKDLETVLGVYGEEYADEVATYKAALSEAKLNYNNLLAQGEQDLLEAGKLSAWVVLGTTISLAVSLYAIMGLIRRRTHR